MNLPASAKMTRSLKVSVKGRLEHVIHKAGHASVLTFVEWFAPWQWIQTLAGEITLRTM